MNPQHFYKAVMTISQDFTNYNVKIYDKKELVQDHNFKTLPNAYKFAMFYFHQTYHRSTE